MTGLQAHFRSLLQECEQHERVLKKAAGIIDRLGPITGEKLDHLTDDELAYLDQFVYRYCRLQDTLGARLLPKLLQAAVEPIADNASYLDQLDHLERIGVVRSCDEWREVRGARNRFSHDYPETEQRAENLRYAKKTSALLFDTMDRVRDFATRARL